MAHNARLECMPKREGFLAYFNAGKSSQKAMNFKFLPPTVFTLALLALVPLSVHAQGTAFTYQGRLNNGGNPANGNYDLTFTLFTSTTPPTHVGSTLTNT